mmetsp:Transcript_5554/g.20240  ORF Transcript_5554/g.20240 Transcript_5554/m.20240 type:complete len:354 (+) Transcript_5554:78-1139(+)
MSSGQQAQRHLFVQGHARRAELHRRRRTCRHVGQQGSALHAVAYGTLSTALRQMPRPNGACGARCLSRGPDDDGVEDALEPDIFRIRRIRQRGLAFSAGLVAASVIYLGGTNVVAWNKDPLRPLSNEELAVLQADLEEDYALDKELDIGSEFPARPVQNTRGQSPTGLGIVLAGTTLASIISIGWLVWRGRLDIEVYQGRMFVGWYPDVSLNQLGDTQIDTGKMIEVRPTGDARGNGAFAVCTIPEGAYIGDYEGEMLSEREYWYRYPSGVSDYCMGLDSDRVFDGTDIAKDTDRFTGAHLNHSRTRCNVLRRPCRRKGKISFYSLRQIEPGEELLIDYGRRYWQGREHLELP